MNEAGRNAELAALDFLLGRGLRLLQSNYRCRFGEIDLIMQDGREIVFVEVRQRSSGLFGGAAASISSHKRQKLVLAARHFLAEHGEQACRFDAMLLDSSDQAGFEWIKNAFDS